MFLVPNACYRLMTQRAGTPTAGPPTRVRRTSKPVLPTLNLAAQKKPAKPSLDPESRVVAAAVARAAYEARFCVGARVEARFRGLTQCAMEDFLFPGRIDACHADGTFAVKYDDGDYEPTVKRRFIRLLKEATASAPSHKPASAVAKNLTAAASTAATVLRHREEDGDEVAEVGDAADEVLFDPFGMDDGALFEEDAAPFGIGL